MKKNLFLILVIIISTIIVVAGVGSIVDDVAVLSYDLMKYFAKYYDDALKVSMKNVKNFPSVTERFVKKYGNKFVDLSKKLGPEVVEVTFKYGDDAYEIIGKYGDNGLMAIRNYGSNALKSIAKNGNKIVEPLANHSKLPAKMLLENGKSIVSTSARYEYPTSQAIFDAAKSYKNYGKFFGIMEKSGSKIIKFIEEHPSAFAYGVTAAAILTIVNDPKKMDTVINGTAKVTTGVIKSVGDSAATILTVPAKPIEKGIEQTIDKTFGKDDSVQRIIITIAISLSIIIISIFLGKRIYSRKKEKKAE